MNSLDHLATIAEVAIALAGFSALVAILGTRAGREKSKLEAFRIQMMLEASLFVVMLALLPSILFEFRIDDRVAWRASAALFLLLDLVASVSMTVRNRELRWAPADRKVGYLVGSLSLAADAAVVVVLLGFAADRAAALYLLALYLNVALSAILFIRFAASTFLPDE